MKKIITLFALSNVLLLSSCGFNNQEEILNGFVVVKNSDGGKLSFDETKNYKKGDTFTFDVTTNEGFYLDSIKSNTSSDIVMVDEDTYSFVLTEDSNVFEPIFKEETETVNCSFNLITSNGGEVSVLGSKFKYGSSINFTCTASEGYEIDSIYFNQKEISINQTGLYNVTLGKNLNFLNVNFVKKTTEESKYEIVNDMKVVRKVVDTKIDTMEDPYKNVSKDDFYKNYKVATSYEDAYFRSKHYLMSGDITNFNHLPDNKNTIKENGVYLKNALATYEVDEDGNYVSYEINTVDGTNYKIYYGGAYTTLEEVSAIFICFWRYSCKLYSC